MPTISIPILGLSGTLSRSARSFVLGGTGGFTLMNITVNWTPNQSSGPVSFSFVLAKSEAGFPAGAYEFAGGITSAKNPCPGFAIACGMCKMPGPGSDEVPWEATGGPIPGGEDTEELSGYDEPSEADDSSEDEKPSACGEKPDNE